LFKKGRVTTKSIASIRNEATILILQDRAVGLERVQDDLRRVRLFTFFSYAASKSELRSYFERKHPDIVVLASDAFPLSFETILEFLEQHTSSIPLIVVGKDPRGLRAMEMLRAGVFDFVE
jgi:DNA-binding NtrC family response regulator